MAVDEEKQAVASASPDASPDHSSVEENRPLPSTGPGFLSRLRGFEATLDRKLGVESEAIDRVKPEDKTEQKWHDQATMALLWASGTMQVRNTNSNQPLCFPISALWDVSGESCPGQDVS